MICIGNLHYLEFLSRFQGCSQSHINIEFSFKIILIALNVSWSIQYKLVLEYTIPYK